jgi:TonB family protein
MGLLSGKGVSALAIATLLVCGVVGAQQTTSEEGKRKVKSKTSPQYSDLARRMGISGKVKIEIVIAPDGHVKSSKVVGGHPLLVQSCVDAVSTWKYEAAPEETTQIVEFEFRPQQ